MGPVAVGISANSPSLIIMRLSRCWRLDDGRGRARTGYGQSPEGVLRMVVPRAARAVPAERSNQKPGADSSPLVARLHLPLPCKLNRCTCERNPTPGRNYPIPLGLPGGTEANRRC